MGQINWTEEAQSWLKEIHDYIAQDNPAAAQRVIRGIYEKVQRLAKFPESGYLYAPGAAEPVRIVLYGHYRIAYIITSARTVEILGVFHGSLDIERFLGPRDLDA